MELGYFVFTSNVDGHFQKAGFPEENVVECHGSINYLQSINQSKSFPSFKVATPQETQSFQGIWKVPNDFAIDVDDPTLRALDPLPSGPPDRPVSEQILARPNVLMFNDMSWVSDREDLQEQRLQAWLSQVRGNCIAVVEIGSSMFVPTVRNVGEGIVRTSRHQESALIRINPNDFTVRYKNDISVPMKGLKALQEIDDALNGSAS